MTHLTILFITRDRSNQVERSSDYLANELKKHSTLFQWHQDGHINDILPLLPIEPDFILLNDYKPDYCPTIRGLDKVDIPKGIMMHDLQYKKFKRKQFIEKAKIDCIFTNYRDAFVRWYPEFADRMIWFPHHVNTDVFMDYQLPKTTNWLMMGANIAHLYPLRTAIINKMMRKKGFVHIPHPGYRLVKDREKNVRVGETYAKEINRAKMFLTCDSVYKFPILKYFEVPACHTLLLASSSKELSDLGFIDGETFIAVDGANFLSKAEYYLHNARERLTIAKKGYEMVRKKHSTKQRAFELIQHIERMSNPNDNHTAK